jgi:hypothetical protein
MTKEKLSDKEIIKKLQAELTALKAKHNDMMNSIGLIGLNLQVFTNNNKVK